MMILPILEYTTGMVVSARFTNIIFLVSGTLQHRLFYTYFKQIYALPSCFLSGRDMVEYLEHGLSYHVAQELQYQDQSSILARLERAFLMADIHSNQIGVTMSGATVAVGLVRVRWAFVIVLTCTCLEI